VLIHRVKVKLFIQHDVHHLPPKDKTAHLKSKPIRFGF
jgi:hypothetical protein